MKARRTASDGIRMCACWVGLCGAVAGGCITFPDAAERLNDDVVVTGYDKEVDFAKYKTFAVDPTVHVIKQAGDSDPIDQDLDAKYADPIVDRVIKHLKDVGYAEVAADGEPDLGVTITAMAAEVGNRSLGWWYAGYWGYPYWGFWYPFGYDSKYNVGTLVTEMVDLNKAGQDNASSADAGGADASVGPPSSLHVVWASAAYRVLRDDLSVDAQWAADSCDQAFAQSPYLGSH